MISLFHRIWTFRAVFQLEQFPVSEARVDSVVEKSAGVVLDREVVWVEWFPEEEGTEVPVLTQLQRPVSPMVMDP